MDSLSDSTTTAAADVEALRRLSDNLSSLFPSPSFSDALLSLPSRDLPVHRCILSARSPFFHRLFSSQDPANSEKFDLGELFKGFEVGFEAVALVLGYLYSGKVGPLPRGVCECADEDCRHAACRPAVEFMVQVLFVAFGFEISELVSLFQRHLLGIVELVAIDDVPMVLAAAHMCSKACMRLLTKCIEIVANSDLDVIFLEKTLPSDIVNHVIKSRSDLGIDGPNITTFPDIRVMRIYKALDSDDIELVKMLLDEKHTTLDDAYALHYAIAHCNSKITSELLNLGLADVNHRNPRGYTVLHTAAMNKEPEIIVSLLTKGAQPSDLTSDGKKAIQIAKRLTKAVDYYRPIEKGKPSPKDRLCIEVLQEAERKGPLTKEASISVAMAASDLLQKLLDLEHRVSLAKLLYPEEAKVAMANAHMDGTLRFTSRPTSDLPAGNQRPTVLSELHFEIKEEHLSRLRALSKTVELGRCYFPRCSEVLNKLMDDELSDLAYLAHNTTGGRKRYQELQNEMMEAFLQDKDEFVGSVSRSPSSKAVRRARPKSAKKCW